MITLPQHPEANQVLGEVATELNVRGINAARYMPASGRAADAYTVEALGAQIEVDSPLKGAHQHRNLALAIAAAVELAEQAWISGNSGGDCGRDPADALAGAAGASEQRTAWNGFWM